MNKRVLARNKDTNKVFYNLANGRKDYLQEAIFAFAEITKSACYCAHLK